ncbi:hypothetical protein ACFYT4_01390 [Streptomyces sp. NPDC004609]|uniref:hypothetical protein n=1 Tax=Streptomyces sp. NPDC004609 TaxID=3364704 RepID=UPI0036C16B89
MTRPAVGTAPHRCAECGGYASSGAPACVTCRELVDAVVEEEWGSFLDRWDIGPDDHGQAAELAVMVTEEPDRHDWRVVDAALDRLVCGDCGGRLSRGPVGCARCDLAHGFRYQAVETDRPGVPPGNEHAVRVNVSVVRRPQITSPGELLVRRMILPALLAGALPTKQEAQRLAALIRSSPASQRTAIMEKAVEELLRG